MRILMLTSDFYDTGHGGVEGHVLGLTRALQDEGHEIVIMRTANRPTIHDYDARADGLDYRVVEGVQRSRGLAERLAVGGRSGLILEFVRRLLSGVGSARLAERVVREVGHVDVVHQHNFLESWGLTRALARRGMRVVWTNHLGEFLYLRKLPFFGRPVLRLLTRHYAAAIGPSDELADRSAVSPGITLIANGVDTTRFRECAGGGERQELRADFGWPVDRRVVIIPRRWAPTKGVVYAAAAMKGVDWPADVHVVFAGSGTQEYPGYSREIRELLTDARTTFEIHESVSQDIMAKMLRASDVCLIPSVKEATSLSALEAMASGTIVVAAAVGGLPEIIEHGTTGLLHEPEDPRSIARQVANALQAPADVSTRARRMVVDHYSWTRVAHRTVPFYAEAT